MTNQERLNRAIGQILAAHQDEMLTAAEWLELARAYAALKNDGSKSIDYFNERQIERIAKDYKDELNESVDGQFPKTE